MSAETDFENLLIATAGIVLADAIKVFHFYVRENLIRLQGNAATGKFFAYNNVYLTKTMILRALAKV